MAEISAALVKQLRDKTDAPMMDCKRALKESDGDLEAAVDWLRAKGISKAATKADRAAAEGLVGVRLAQDGARVRGVAIELNSETDFVARNVQFQRAATIVSAVALTEKGDVSAILAAAAPDGGTIQDMITGLIATIGENMTLRRAAYLEVSSGAIASYVHAQIAEGLGRIAVLVALESTKPSDALDALANQLAQHVAAAAPIALSDADIPAERLERERAVALEQVKGDPKLAGKPQQVLDGAVTGKVRKVLEDLVLLRQKFIHDDKLTVEQAVKAAEKEVGAPITVKGFVRFQLGEGIEKKVDDFAAEVAATIGKG